MKQTAYYARVAGALLLICTVVSLLLATVNLFTRDIIAKNAEEEQKAAIVALFPGMTDMTEHPGSYAKEVQAVFAVQEGESVAGYAVSLLSRGFGGDVHMMVGIAPDGTVSGVRVITHSETPGLGSKALADTYLQEFVGVGEPLVIKEDIDAVSGATISSRAVVNGINLALSLGLGGDAA